MSLARERVEFTVCVGKLLRYADANGYLLALDEGRVFKERKGYTKAGVKQTFTDAIHIANSKHYSGLAIDTVLYQKQGEKLVPVVMDHPIWRDLGRFWKMCDPKCSWGGDFKSVDLNHFSWGE